jgi:hypothetical protein
MCVRERIITPSISACPPNASDGSSLFLANSAPTLQLSATVAFQRSPYKEGSNHINAFSGKHDQAFMGSNLTQPLHSEDSNFNKYRGILDFDRESFQRLTCNESQ